MSGTEIDWEEEVAKQEDRINLTEVTKDELTNYVQCKMYVYTEIHDQYQLDLILWELFQGHFKDFMVNTFTKIPLYWL